MVLGVVRKVRENPFSVTARLSSSKLGRMVQAESLLEYDFLSILDFDPRVEKYGEQCLVLPWADGPTGRKRRYCPDVLVKFHPHAIKADPRLRATIYEVKPHEVLRAQWPELKLKYRAVRRSLSGTGVRFRLMTDSRIDPVFAKNVQFLLTYKHERFQNEKSRQDREIDAELLAMVWQLRGTITPQAVLDHFGQTFELRARVLTRLWYAVATCVFDCDLVTPLNMNTPLWPGQFHRAFDVYKSFPTPKWRLPEHDWYR